MVVEKKLYTVDEFDSFIDLPENRDRLFELIDGEIVEKVPTEEHGLIVSNLHGWLFIYLREKDTGRLVIEVRHRVPKDNENARLPDIAFTRKERLKPPVKKGAVLQMPDLAIEVQSPRDSLKDMRDKADYYLEHGARLVWLVYPEKRLIEVLTPDERDLLTENDTLTGGDVLPGFTLPIRDIFAL